jgi:hypothetical protein
MFTGDTDGDAATDEIVVVDGMIVYREGDPLGGEVLSGAIEGAYQNEDGDLAFIWDIQNNTFEALFFNGQLLLKEGDAVDWDGDLIPDPSATLVNFSGISTLTLSDRDQDGNVRIYFTADVEVTGDGPRSGGAAHQNISWAAPPGDPEEQGLTAAEAEIGLPSSRGGAGRTEYEAVFVMTVATGGSAIEPTAENRSPALGRLTTVRPSVLAGQTASVGFHLPAAGHVRIDLFDAGGRWVRELAAGSYEAGEHRLLFDGRDSDGHALLSGTYLVRLSCGASRDQRRIAVLH